MIERDLTELAARERAAVGRIEGERPRLISGRDGDDANRLGT
jgi:hypothetical protein